MSPSTYSFPEAVAKGRPSRRRKQVDVVDEVTDRQQKRMVRPVNGRCIMSSRSSHSCQHLRLSIKCKPVDVVDEVTDRQQKRMVRH